MLERIEPAVEDLIAHVEDKAGVTIATPSSPDPIPVDHHDDEDHDDDHDHEEGDE